MRSLETAIHASVRASILVIFLVTAGFPGSAGAAGVQRSATGEGLQLTGAGVGFRTFAFGVLEQGSGHVTGEVHVQNPVIASDRVFRLDCLNVFPGKNGSPIAVASGVLVAAENPTLIGQPGIFAVQDTGEGQDPPDRMTLGVLLNPTACTVFTSEDALVSIFPRGLAAIDDGNIQVRP